ncbi:uncharacterized protein LOC132313839 [Cornus florida]|uniref:uncharacterized protein LOC132313839 n=1 Tax=Cornus florida TaxID=4283 RepID=UPI00289C8852|nr:uncharacterized protein LOC132313839 [Cornus florida]
MVSNEVEKTRKFVSGLDYKMRPLITAQYIKVYSEAVERALMLEVEAKDRNAGKELWRQKRNVGLSSEGPSWRGTGVQLGYYKSNCPMRSSSVSSALRACYRCGQQGHLIRDCLNQEAGTVFGSWAHVLFDSGASHSCIASSFVFTSGLEISFIDRALCVDTPVGVSVSLSRIVRDYSIVIAGRTFVFDLILLEITGFDVILEMDWLASFRATIDCFRGRVTFCTPEGDCFFFMGDRSDPQPSSLYEIQGRSHDDYFLASLLAEEDDAVGTVYLAVVCDFLDAFSERLDRVASTSRSGVHY